MQSYILKSLKLSNSNFLDDLEIEFDCKFTLIQGPNGSGKTSLYMAMRTGEWISKGQTGQLDLQYRQKSLDAEIHDLIYIGESWRNLDQNHQYQKYFVQEDFINQFLENLNAAKIELSKLSNSSEVLNIASIFSEVRQWGYGSQYIGQLLLLKTLRKYIGINGALILQDGVLAILDIPTRQLAIEVLSSISEQIVIFEANWWSEVHKEFSFDNLNIIQLQGKRI
jgi:ABC-type molybdenum transport system ATPase subunit/photorepair protein PhrA